MLCSTAMASIAMPLDHHKNVDLVPGEERGDLIDETLAVWQPRATRQLTREDGRQIIENMVGFFSVLREWNNAERVKRRRTKHPS
ncbi:MAG TPA: hypothetical protein VIJ04_17450 [Xanthobacteraceae bacterium]